jgi:hypothetical protein
MGGARGSSADPRIGRPLGPPTRGVLPLGGYPVGSLILSWCMAGFGILGGPLDPCVTP